VNQVTEMDTLELGFRAAVWWAAASGDPYFMLARQTLRGRPPRGRGLFADLIRDTGMEVPGRGHGHTGQGG
jgi:hypothetical protein